MSPFSVFLWRRGSPGEDRISARWSLRSRPLRPTPVLRTSSLPVALCRPGTVRCCLVCRAYPHAQHCFHRRVPECRRVSHRRTEKHLSLRFETPIQHFHHCSLFRKFLKRSVLSLPVTVCTQEANKRYVTIFRFWTLQMTPSGSSSTEEALQTRLNDWKQAWAAIRSIRLECRKSTLGFRLAFLWVDVNTRGSRGSCIFEGRPNYRIGVSNPAELERPFCDNTNLQPASPPFATTR